MKETAKEGRIYALFGKAFLLSAAALVMLCIHPLTAHAEPYSGDGWKLDLTSGNLTIDSDDGMYDWSLEKDSTNKYEYVKTVTVSEGVTEIVGAYGYDRDRPFSGCKFLTTISLPSTLKKIEDRSFYGCENLTSIDIPASVTSIGEEAFSDCKKLALVNMLGESPPTLGGGSGSDNVFSGAALSSDTDSPNKIYVPESSIATYKGSWPQWADYIYDGSGGGEDPEKPDPDEPENPDDPAENAVMGMDPTAEDYVDTTIDVQAHTLNKVVYSVDVEWGAMTFRYENSIWDSEAHQTLAGAGWQVYDSVNDQALDTAEDAINRIQVTNHSNADVKAVLVYAGETGYEDTTGSFAKAQGDEDTNYDNTEQTLTLATADNGGGEDGAGKATVGCVYFMPAGIDEGYKTGGIAKWTQLGTIKVGIETVE